MIRCAMLSYNPKSHSLIGSLHLCYPRSSSPPTSKRIKTSSVSSDSAPSPHPPPPLFLPQHQLPPSYPRPTLFGSIAMPQTPIIPPPPPAPAPTSTPPTANRRKRRFSQQHPGSTPTMSTTPTMATSATVPTAGGLDVEHPFSNLPESSSKRSTGRTNIPWTAQEELRLKAMREASRSWSDIAKVCLLLSRHENETERGR